MMESMPPLEWTQLATKDDIGELEVRPQAHTELTMARSTRTAVTATLGATMANFVLQITALNVA
jgi:hypothetical protein